MFIYLLFKVIFLTAFMCLLIQFRFSAKKSDVIVSAFSVCILILNCLIGCYFGAETLGKVFLLTATIPAFFGFLSVSRSGATKVLFSLLTGIFSSLARFVGKLVYISWNSSLLAFFVEILADTLLLFVIIRFFRKPYLRMFDVLDKGWGYLCLVPGLLSALLFYLMYYPAPLLNQPENTFLMAVIFALTVVFYMILYLNFENITQYYELKHDRQITEIQLDMHKKEFEALQESINAVKIYRHDMRHCLTAVDTPLSENNIAEALNLIRKLDGNLHNTIVEWYCENYIVNVLLSSYIRKAQDEQVSIMCEADVPEKTNINPVEIGLIFANAIENAINACKKIDDSENRKISVVCREHNGQLVIRVSNPYDGEIKFDGEYPVAESPEHGTGTRSIAAIARKNGGVFCFTARDGVFDMTVSFNYYQNKHITVNKQ